MEADTNLQTTVEQLAVSSPGAIRYYLANTRLDRLFSLRHELPDAWHKLVQSPPGTAIEIVLTERHLPFFAAHFLHSGGPPKTVNTLEPTRIALLLQTATSPTSTVIRLDNSSLSFPTSPPPSDPAPVGPSDPATGLPGGTVTSWASIP